ncbi:unnamed protein product, partial [Effrenium voratum]
VKRCCQQQALREALEGSYDELFAQVTKARQQAVELEHLEKAEEKLKAMRKQRLHVAPNCSKEELRQLMAWARVTRTPEPAPQASLCPTAGCPCNQSLDGEVLSIQHDALSDFGPEADKEMFEMLVEAAISSEEGAVWPAGGKLIFSAFDRNQSVNALVRTLETAGQRRCAEMLLALAKAAGESAGGFVSAAQVNFHVDGSSFHDQHRDVYSAKQRAGPNCACSFRECVGTLCYSLGSSRLCRLRSMVDDLSFLRPCGETCRGYQEDRWLHSGDAMFFNALWNLGWGPFGLPAGVLARFHPCGLSPGRTVLTGRQKLETEYIAHVKDQKVIALVQELFKESNCGSPPSKAQQDSDEPGWLSPVRSALMLQAKRKGLACSSLCPESLHRIWTKPKTSLREKLDQCRALMLNSADEILDSLEALSDLSSACSLMVALGNKTATLSPHNALQLAPILILVSLVGAHAANEEGEPSRCGLR